ncbi:MAG: YncE family protein [Acidimicrobiales bacterium]
MGARRYLGPVAAAAVALAALAGCGPGDLGHPGYRPQRPPPTMPTTTSSTAPSPGKASAWATLATIPVGPLVTLVGGPGAVYALPSDVGFDHTVPLPVQVVRVAVPSRAETESKPITGASAMAVSGNSLWVVASSDVGATNLTVTLDQLDATTLTLRRSIHLSADPISRPETIAAVPGGPLWVGIGKHLYRVDPAKGTVTATFTAPGYLAGLAVSPDDTVLYAAGAQANGAGLTVTERNAVSGATLATASHPESVVGGSVSATTAGVWASFRTGMLGDTIFLRRADLRQVVPSAGMTLNLASRLVAAMGVQGTVSHGVLWLSNFQTLACADPTTGQVRSSEQLKVGVAGQVVASPGAIYVVGGPGIEVIAPPRACGVAGAA